MPFFTSQDTKDQELIQAAFDGDTVAARNLIKRGANVNAKDDRDWTPLMRASFKGHLEVVRLLVESGADVNGRGENDWTPLIVACYEANTDIARFLIEKGADPDARSSGSGELTALHLASSKGDLATVKVLIDGGANVDVRNNTNATSLIVACSEEAFEVAKLLIQSGANVNDGNSQGLTPLHVAAYKGNAEVARMLVDKGADIDARDSELGVTALDIAQKIGHTNIIQLLRQPAPPVDPDLSSDMPFSSLEHVLLIVNENEDAALESPVLTAMLESAVGKYLEEIKEKVHIDIIGHSDAAIHIHQVQGIPESVREEIAARYPDLAEQMERDAYKINLLCLVDPDVPLKGAIFLFYSYSKRMAKPKFLEKRTTPNGTYEVYLGSDAESAKEFLQTKKVTEAKYYIKVETPEGTWGLDKEGFYLESLLDWQTDIDRAQCEGGLDLTSVAQFSIEWATKGEGYNFVAQVCCGKCGHKWLDGVRYQNFTVVRCPRCRSYNKVDSNNIRVITPQRPEVSDVNINPVVTDEIAVGIENLICRHLARMCGELQGHPQFQDLPKVRDQLASDEKLSFTVEAIQRKLPDCLSTKELATESRLFSDWFVAVTICPWLMPDEIRPHLPQGYLALLNQVTLPAYAASNAGGRHVAHWMYCTDGRRDGVHLTLIPNTVNRAWQIQPIIAQDFLSPDERRQMGM